MDQRSGITTVLKIIKRENPKLFNSIIEMGSAERMQQVATFATLGEVIFKERPPGFQFCYFVADFNYAQDLALCDLITDPKLKADCKAAAKVAYCNAFDSCGEA